MTIYSQQHVQLLITSNLIIKSHPI